MKYIADTKWYNCWDETQNIVLVEAVEEMHTKSL